MTLVYSHTGITNDKKWTWKIVDSEALKSIGTHSTYEINENSDLLQGMRIKLMATYTAAGYAAPLCAVVSGLDENKLIMTDEELKESKGIFVLKDEGLSMHSGVDPTNKQPECIMFLRSSKNVEYNVDQTRYDYYLRASAHLHLV